MYSRIAQLDAQLLEMQSKYDILLAQYPRHSIPRQPDSPTALTESEGVAPVVHVELSNGPSPHVVPAAPSSSFNTGRMRTPRDIETDSPEQRIAYGYIKPHDRPLPSADQLLHQISSGFDTIVQTAPINHIPAPIGSDTLVHIDKASLPPEDQIVQLVQHFETYNSAAFPIFHIPTFNRWVEDSCFKGIAIEAEEACAVLRENFNACHADRSCASSRRYVSSWQSRVIRHEDTRKV